MKSIFIKKHQLTFAFTLILLFIISVASFKSISSLLDSSLMVNKAQNAIMKMEKLVNSLRIAESYHHGYVITGDKKYISLSRKGYNDALYKLVDVQLIVQDNETQRKNADSVKFLLISRLNIKDNPHTGDSVSHATLDTIYTNLEAIRDSRKMVREMQLTEYKILTDKINTLNKYSNFAPILSVIAAITVISMTISLYKRLQKNMDVNAALDRERELMKKKDEFLTIASHELKTPLTSMKGYLQIVNTMLNRDGIDKYQGFILKANKQADRLNVLVRDLLTVSKINAEQIEYHFSEFNFADIIEDTLVFAHELSQTHKIEVLGNRDITLYADKGRIEQVVSNLVSNAIKYSPNSEDIMLTIEETFDKNLRFSVTDKGIGIDKKKAAFVFDRFYRINEKNYNTSGLGIGLYISAEIIKRHQGEIGLNSRPGKGSTFWFSVPLLNINSKSEMLVDHKHA